VAPQSREPALNAAPKTLITAPAGQPGETLICFSHLRWDFVFQRPQHLMTRFARTRRVFYFEEPCGYDVGQTEPDLWMQTCERSGVIRVVPRVPTGLSERELEDTIRRLLDRMLVTEGVRRPVLWYYTPMMLGFSRHLAAGAVVYDCMDELANFKGAPPELMGLERELFAKADLVTTGGYSLYEAKRLQHANVHAFPSSVDREHLGQARTMTDGDEPADQASIEHPRLGFYGVIDERMDLELIDQIAAARPDWALVMVGPVVKIEEDDLPRRPNIHYLGGNRYSELPRYLAGLGRAADAVRGERRAPPKSSGPTRRRSTCRAACRWSPRHHDVVRTTASGRGRHAHHGRRFRRLRRAAMRAPGPWLKAAKAAGRQLLGQHLQSHVEARGRRRRPRPRRRERAKAKIQGHPLSVAPSL
jgi:hypothetical protein